MTTTLHAWAVQDALTAALSALSGDTPVSFGFPAGTRPPECVWVSEEIAEWDFDYELSTGSPSEESFALIVRMVTTLSGTAAEIRTRLATMLGWLITALEPSAGLYLAGTATWARLTSLRVDAGGDGAVRQLAAEAKVTIVSAMF